MINKKVISKVENLAQAPSAFCCKYHALIGFLLCDLIKAIVSTKLLLYINFDYV